MVCITEPEVPSAKPITSAISATGRRILQTITLVLATALPGRNRQESTSLAGSIAGPVIISAIRVRPQNRNSPASSRLFRRLSRR